MGKTRVAVLFGGKSCEHDVSIISGLQALKALDAGKYDGFPVYIDQTGAWYVGEGLDVTSVYTSFNASRYQRVLPSGEQGRLVLRAWPDGKCRLFSKNMAAIKTADVVLPVMHGVNGEDGTLQGMLELFGVPYASSGVLGSAIGMDKIAMKTFFRGCGFPVLQSEWFDRAEWAASREEVLDRLEAALPYPMFVKPANLGSSIGISRAVGRASLASAIDVAAAYDRRILVEQGIEHRVEVNCSVLGYGGYIRPSVLEMPEQTQDDLLSFGMKYLHSAKGPSKGMRSLARQIPAPISESMTAEIQALSARVFREMDLKGCVRIDYLIDGDSDKYYICEVNTIPGSLAYYLWEPSGEMYSQLLDEMIVFAYRERAEKTASVFSYDSEILARQSSAGKLGGKMTGAKLGGKLPGDKLPGGKR